MTTLSPNMVGKTLTRKSTGWPPTVEPDAAVLRQAPLGDVQIGHDLHPRRDGEGQVPRRRHHFVQHAVGADADFELVLERLEVQVAGVLANRQQQHHVQQLPHRALSARASTLVRSSVVLFSIACTAAANSASCSMSAINVSTLSPPAE